MPPRTFELGLVCRGRGELAVSSAPSYHLVRDATEVDACVT